ncbi:ZNF91 protein, partial [Acromyrmex insinuator]
MTIAFPCRLCGKIYAHKSSMYTHLRLCGKEPKFSCVLCGRRFKYKHRLQSHLTSNPICGRRGSASSVVSVTWDENNRKLNFVICPDCGRICKDDTHLLRRECKKERNFVCLTCDKAFRRRYHLQRHIPKTNREEHTEAEIREEASNLQMHKMHQELSIGNILAKTSEIGVWRPSQHPARKKQLGMGYGLLAQMLMSQDNNVEWTQRRASGSSYKMSRGIRKKSIGGDAKYECSRCGKTYKATTSLSRHKRLECGVVPCEVCPICGRRFKHRFVLNAHILFHTSILCRQNSRYEACFITTSKIQMKNEKLYDSVIFPTNAVDLNTFKIITYGVLMNKFELNVNHLNTSRHFVNCGQIEPLPKQYFCGECGKVYKWMDNLRRHQRLECGKLPKWHYSNDELSDWLVEPFVKQELKEGGCFEFVTVPNQLSSDHENEQCTAEKSNDEEPEICEVAFHGQLKYLLCDSPILNSVESNVVQKNSKSCQQFRCDGCGRAYTRVDSLKRHQQKCDELLASFQDRQEALIVINVANRTKG